MRLKAIRCWLALALAGTGVWSSPAAWASEPARLALLIGNQTYDPSVGVLKNPHNDIALVGNALTRQGFAIMPPLKDATRVQILGAVRDFAPRLNEAGAGAVGFLYYSGHGASEAGTNINYLIPIDANKPGSESFWDESVNFNEVLNLLGNAREAAKFVVFDACRDELRLPYRGSKGFLPVREQPGIFVAYSAAPGQPASDEGERSGPYAAALAAELAKPGLDHLTLFQNVKEAVYAATKGAQEPWESNGLLRRIYLTGKPAVPAVVSALEFVTYRDPKGNYSFELPKDWLPEPNKELAEPAVAVFARGRETVDGKEVPIDVAVSVTRLSRRPEDFPSRTEYAKFRRSTLLQVDALFGPPDPELPEPLRSRIYQKPRDITIAGIPGKAYQRDYDFADPHVPSAKPFPISIEDTVLRTGEAYYVLEYRARRNLFEKYHFVAERLRGSFQPK